MIYTKNGKRYTIPNEDIQKLMDKLKLSKGEALDLWLADNELVECEEQKALDTKAKKQPAEKTSSGQRKAPSKPRTTKISDEKKAVFDTILHNLDRCPDVYPENIEVVKENKLIFVHINGKIIKIDIIEQKKK